MTIMVPADLATFENLANIARSKWELMESLSSEGVAIVPWGEASLEPHIHQFNKQIIYFGENTSCTVRASAVEIKEQTHFLLHIGAQSARVHLPVQGRFNVRNALASAAVGWALQIPIENIIEGLNNFTPPPMRMERIYHPSGAVLLNDAYNANPASMVHSVGTLMESFYDRKKIVVLGSMKELGSESEKLHFHLGTEIGKCALEYIYLIGRETKAVRAGAVAVGWPEEKICLCENADDLAKHLKNHLQPDTAILLKGSRAMRLERVIDDLIKPVKEIK